MLLKFLKKNHFPHNNFVKKKKKVLIPHLMGKVEHLGKIDGIHQIYRAGID